MSNSRMNLKRESEKPTNSSKGKGLILETPYKPGFVEDKDLESVKMAVDKELSDVANAFQITTERTADTITRIDKIEVETDGIGAKIEEVDRVSKEGDKALAERITTFEAKVDGEFGEVNASIVETRRVMAEQDGLLAERIDSIVGSFEGELGPLLAEISEVRRISISGDQALATSIDSLKTNMETADATLDAAIKTESNARVTADGALTTRIDSLTANMNTADANLSAAITSEQEARVNADGALASEVSRVEAGYKTADGEINAAVQTETTARVNGDNALASQITTVKAELDGQIGEVRQFATVEVGKIDGKVDAETAARQLEQAVIDGKITAEEAARQYQDGVLSGDIGLVNGKVETINAKWGVELDVNGKISGVVMNNNGARSNFEVRADLFKFTDTSGGTSGGFSSSGGVTSFNGVIYAQGGTFNGTVNAISGVFDHVVINETCTYKGKINSSQILDAAVTGISKQSHYGPPGQTAVGVSSLYRTIITGTINTPREYSRTVMVLYPTAINFYATNYSSTFNQTTFKIEVLLNGGIVSEIILFNDQTRGEVNMSLPAMPTISIPAGFSGSYEVRAYAYKQNDSVGISFPAVTTFVGIYKPSSDIS